MSEDKRQHSKWPIEKHARLKAAKTLLNSGRGNMLMVLALKVGIEGVSKLTPKRDDVSDDMQLLLDYFLAEFERTRHRSAARHASN